MKTIEINGIQIEVSDNTIALMESRSINAKQEVYIRNKRDANRLAKQTSELFEESRKQRLKQAINNNDMMYLNIMLDNISMFEIIKEILSRKLKNL